MAGKVKKFRVAVSGTTIDGRAITPEMLKSAAKSYDFSTRPARINLNHIKGYSPEPPFNAYGDVLSLETREEEMVFNGKKEKITALYAEISANDQLIDLNKKGQALYTSIELYPNYRGQEGVWAFVGLAITDNPASFGTHRLEFSAFPAKIEGVEFTDALQLEFPKDEETDNSVKSIAAQFAQAFAAVFAPAHNQDAAIAATKTQEPPKNEFDAVKLAEIFAASITKLGDEFKTQIGELKASNEKTANDLAALTAKLEATKSQNHQTRPSAIGTQDGAFF